MLPPLPQRQLTLSQQRLNARDVLAHLAPTLRVGQLAAGGLEPQVEQLLPGLIQQSAQFYVTSLAQLTSLQGHSPLHP